MPKISSCFKYNSNGLGGKKTENTENDQKAILSWGHKGLLFWVGDCRNEKKKIRKEKKLETHQQSQWFALKKEENTPKQVDLSLWEAVLMMFARMSELGKNTETVTSHQWRRSTRAHFS